MTRSVLFSAFGMDEIRRIVETMRPRVVEAGERFIEKGEEGTSMYVVTSGSFNCTIPVNGELRIVKTCSAGDIFGELAIIYAQPRAANVVCWDRAVVWELNKEVFWGATRKNGQQFLRVVQSIFSFFDQDESGNIDREEARVATVSMGEAISDKELDKLMLRFDSDGDGEISLDEFTAMISTRRTNSW
jgi:CRP-like cAMP-binding protein